MRERRPRRATWAGLALLLLAAPAARAAPFLLRDLAPGSARFPAELATEGLTDGAGFHYFAASDPAHGRELWRSDGTAAGTVRLTDTCPGPCSGTPVPLALAHGRVYFTADDGTSGRELWSSGPDPGDTEPVRDLCPGPCAGNPTQIVALGDALYFLAWSPLDHATLFRSDGTREGTRPVREVCSTCTFLAELHPFRGQLLFTLPDSELWVSDGTAVGTLQVRQRFAGRPFPLDLDRTISAAFDEQHYFFITQGQDLFETDLTPAGTHLVRNLAEILPDLGTRVPQLVRSTFWNGRLIARLELGELIASDGTPAGTRLLNPSPGSYSRALLPLPAAVLDFDQDGTVYATTGTPESTVPILDIHGGHPDSDDAFDSMAKIGDLAFFTLVRVTADARSLPELWTSDGTAAGTHRIGAAPPEIESFEPPLAPTPGPFYLVEGMYVGGTVLWRSDGTEAGTFAVRDFGDAAAASGPLAQTKLGGQLFFSASPSPTAAPLFATDGTTAGTRVVSATAQWAQSFARLGPQLLFDAVTPAGLHGLWRTDGTAAGTRRVAGRGGLTSPTSFGSFLLYGGTRMFGETELFRTDGTPEGTGLVENIDPFRIDTAFHHSCTGASSRPGPGVAIGHRAVFAADDGIHGRELFVTDGTRRGTSLLEDINPRRAAVPPPACGDEPDPRRDTGLSSDPRDLLAWRGGALFAADDGRTGRELWITDGTAPGTRRLRDLKPGPRGAKPHDLVPFRGQVYFLADTAPAGGDALWRTDGTAAGTVEVADLTLAGFPAWASRLTAVGGQLFFTVYNEETGSELWASHGDRASTHLVADLHPGATGSAPQSLTDVQGILVFAADDGTSGLEPWRSDGTAAGTRRLGDLNPGPDASGPGPFDLVGTVVVTGADDGTHGREPWALPLADVVGR